MKIFHKLNLSKEIFLEFPFAIIFGILSAFIGVYENHAKFNIVYDENLFNKLFYFAENSMILSISLQLFFRHRNFSTFLKICIYFLFFIFLGFFTYYFTNYSLIFLSLALVLSLFFFNFLFISSTNKAFLSFFISFAEVLIYWLIIIPIILAMAFGLVFLSIDYLFGLKIHDNYFIDIFYIISFIFIPILLISNFPKVQNFNLQSFALHKSASILIKYIFVGFLSIYGLILYIYFTKITIYFELPKGGITLMVLIFTSFVILTKFLLLGVANKHKLAIFFDKYAFYFLVIPIIFLYIAIFKRINEYGLSEFRIIVVLIGIWFGLITLSYIFIKNLHYKYIFISLFICLIMTSFINIEKISGFSQLKRFRNILIENKILQNEKIIFQKNISKEVKTEIKNLSKYISKNIYISQDLEKLLGKCINNEKEILDILKINFIQENALKISYDFYHEFKNISGYDYILEEISITNNDNVTLKLENEKILVNLKDMKLNLKFENNETLNFYINEVIKILKKHNIQTINQKTVKHSTQIKQNKNYKIKVQIISIYMQEKIKIIFNIALKKLI